MTWRRAFPRAVLTAFLCGLCLHVGRCAGNREAESHYEGVIARIDTASAKQYEAQQEQIRRLTDEKRSIREVLEGVRTLTPRTRTVYDTIVNEITNTVTERVVVSGGGIEVLNLRPDSTGFRPIRDTYRLGNCDDRLEIVRGTVVCDPARLGHITLFARVGTNTDLANGVPDLGAISHAGIAWQPHFKSTTQVELYGDGQGRANLTARIGWRIF